MHLTKRQLFLSLASVLAIMLIGAGVAYVLKSIVPRNTTDLSQVSSRTPSQVIETFSLPGKIKDLSEASYLQQTDQGGAAYVRYRLEGHNYTISTQTTTQILFYAKSKGQPDDTIAVQNETTSFMHEEGYDKVQAPTTASSADDVAYATYASHDAICQLTDSPPLPNVRSYHALACVSKSDIEKEYTSTDKLVDLYKQSHQLDTFNEVVRTDQTQDNKSLSILSFTTANSHPVLLFAAIDNKWEFLGDLSSRSGEESNGKYVIDPDLKLAISAPKYGTFLTKYLQS